MDVASFATSGPHHPDGQSAVPWLLLDLFLFWRVWHGSRPARYLLLVLSTLGVTLGILVLVVAMTRDAVVGPDPVSFLLLAASAACLARVNPSRNARSPVPSS